jgi:hypothetical protein
MSRPREVKKEPEQRHRNHFTETIESEALMVAQPQAKPEHDIVEVIYLGDPRPMTYEPHESVEAAQNGALDLFGITTNRHIMALFDAAGEEITDEKQSMQSAGVKPGDKLMLGQSKVKGG